MSAVLAPTRYKLSVGDYHKLGEAGILNEDSRVELLDGDLIAMAPIGGLHMAVVNRLNRLLVLAVGDLGVVSVQNPVRLPPYSEPQPDVAILKPCKCDAASVVPGVEDVLLIIEVADTTLVYDRTTKLPLYSSAGIAESWIVNLQSRSIEVYRRPTPEGYSERIDCQLQDRASSSVLPALSLSVAEVFG